MDNEKKERLKALRENMKSYGYTDGVEELDAIFPELTESEDEKIIKTLQEYVKNRNWMLNGPTQYEVLAWLEKKGESNIDKLRKISTPAEENWFEIQKQWEQEDSADEDEKVREELIQYLRDYPHLPNGKYSRLDFFAWLEKHKEYSFCNFPKSCDDCPKEIQAAIDKEFGINGRDDNDNPLNGYGDWKKGMVLNGPAIWGLVKLGTELQKEQNPVSKPKKFYDSMDDLIADALIEEIEDSELPEGAKHNRIHWIKTHRQKLVDNVSKDEYVKRFKALCNAYEINLPNREYDIYHLCDDLHKLSVDYGKQKPSEWREDERIRKYLIWYVKNAGCGSDLFDSINTKEAILAYLEKKK